MNIIFMGTPDYATIILKELLKHFNIVSVFTQKDKKFGRKQILKPSDVKKFIIDNNLDIPVYYELDVNLIKSMKPDFIVVAAYGKILPKEVLEIAPCINLHASILPKYRGASPIQEAILNGDKFSGVTAMLMDIGLDTGDILGYKFTDIRNLDVKVVFDKLSILAKDLIIDVINNFNNIRVIKQNSFEATYCKKIKKEDGLVLLENAKDVYLKFLAYKYWPGIFLESGLKLKDIEINELTSKNNKGIILDIQNEYFILSCNIGSLKIKSVQAPSKKEISAKDFINGKRLKIGDKL